MSSAISARILCAIASAVALAAQAYASEMEAGRTLGGKLVEWASANGVSGTAVALSMDGSLAESAFRGVKEAMRSGEALSIYPDDLLADAKSRFRLTLRRENLRKEIADLNTIGVRYVLDLAAEEQWDRSREHLEKVSLRLRIHDAEADGDPIGEVTTEFVPDVETRRALGEVFPASLIVKARQPAATLFLNDVERGEVGNREMQLSLRPGVYDVQVRSPGFRDYVERVSLAEQDKYSLTVETTTSHSFAPALGNLVLPGAAGTACAKEDVGSWAVALNGLAALTFYTGAVLFATDAIGKPDAFLTGDDRDRYESTVQTELLVMGSAYLVSAITGFVANVSWWDSQRRVVKAEGGAR